MNTQNVHPFPTDPFHATLLEVGIPIGFRHRFDPDAEDNLHAHISASAPSTLYGFRSDIVRWIAYCRDTGVDALKPQPRDVRDFIKEYESGRLPNTVKRMVANIASLPAPSWGTRMSAILKW